MKFILYSFLFLASVSTHAQSEVFPFETIQNPPLFNGCTLGALEENTSCTQKAIEAFAKQKFNTGLFKNLNLNEKRVRVYAQFIIDATGKVTNIKVRTAHPQLEKEAKRVLDLLPRLTPGKQDGKLVATKYNLPLVFILG